LQENARIFLYKFSLEIFSSNYLHYIEYFLFVLAQTKEYCIDEFKFFTVVRKRAKYRVSKWYNVWSCGMVEEGLLSHPGSLSSGVIRRRRSG